MEEWENETDARMAADEAQAMRELEDEAQARKNATSPTPGQTNL
jgi:hypothetical protein